MHEETEALDCYIAMPNELITWLLTGERGLSSNAIVEVMAGLPAGAMTGGRATSRHPHDADDLRRCILLLEAVPGYRARLSELASVSGAWAALIGNWDELSALLRSEIGDDLPRAHPRALQTNARMFELISAAGALW